MTDDRGFPPFSRFTVDGHTAAWTDADGTRVEDWTLTWENEAWTASGRLLVDDVQYVVRLSPTWQVRQFLLFRDLDQPDLWLATDREGRWGEMNGVYRNELEGVTDVDLTRGAAPVTAFPRSVPIRRLGLDAAPIGTEADVTTMVIDIETLAVVPATVTYERTGERRWSRRHPTDAELQFDVDEFGLVATDPGHFQRVSR